MDKIKKNLGPNLLVLHDNLLVLIYKNMFSQDGKYEGLIFFLLARGAVALNIFL